MTENNKFFLERAISHLDQSCNNLNHINEKTLTIGESTEIEMLSAMIESQKEDLEKMLRNS